MLSFRPRPSLSGAVSILVGVVALGLAVQLIWRLWSVTFDAFAILAAAVSLLLALCGVQLLGAELRLRRLAYYLDDEALRIRWGWARVVVPLGRVQRVIRGGQVRGIPRRRFLGWLGYEAGLDTVRDVGKVLFLVRNRYWHDLVFVATAERVYALSVPHPDRLAAEVEARMAGGEEGRELSPAAYGPELVQASVLRAAVPRLAAGRRGGGEEAVGLGRDWPALGLAAAAVGSALGLAAYVVTGYGALAELIPDRFTTREMAVASVSASRVFLLPFGAAVLLLLNLGVGFAVHRRERLATYLCFAAAVAVQIPLWVAALRVMG